MDDDACLVLLGNSSFRLSRSPLYLLLYLLLLAFPVFESVRPVTSFVVSLLQGKNTMMERVLCVLQQRIDSSCDLNCTWTFPFSLSFTHRVTCFKACLFFVVPLFTGSCSSSHSLSFEVDARFPSSYRFPRFSHQRNDSHSYSCSDSSLSPLLSFLLSFSQLLLFCLGFSASLPRSVQRVNEWVIVYVCVWVQVNERVSRRRTGKREKREREEKWVWVDE